MNCKKPLTMKDIKKEAIKENSRLWIIEYNISNVGKGCAVVKANTAKSAGNILIHDGIYNGVPELYSITRIEEIIPSPEPMLLCEQLLTTSSN